MPKNETEVEATNYSTETPAESVKAETKKVRAPLTVPGAGLGRRKEAIARVRMVPGTCLLYTSDAADE